MNDSRLQKMESKLIVDAEPLERAPETSAPAAPPESVRSHSLNKLGHYTVAGLFGGLLIFAIETIDRVIVLWTSLWSPAEALIFASYFTPIILVGIGIGCLLGILYVAAGAVVGATTSLVNRVAPRLPSWASGLATAAMIAVAIGYISSLLVPPSLWVTWRYYLWRIGDLYGIGHWKLEYNVVILFTAVVIVAVLCLVAFDYFAERGTFGRRRVTSLAFVACALAVVVALYVFDSRVEFGRYDSVIHFPVTLTMLVLACLLVGALQNLSSRRTFERAIPEKIVAPALGVAIVGSGFAFFHFGSSQSLKALAWHRTAVARRAYAVLTAAWDIDQDGFSSLLEGGDCQDLEPAVNPRASEILGNGVDDNCIGGDRAASAPRNPFAQQQASALPATTGAGMNFIFIVVDTLRADRMSLYGYERDTTPVLNELAKTALVFERAYSPGMSTGPTLAAVQRSAWRDHVFDPDRPSLFGTLRRNGYVTAQLNASRADFWIADWRPYRELLLDGIERFPHRTGALVWDADEVTTRAIEYLQSVPAQTRHATWVHYLDPHVPRRKMEPFNFGDSYSDKYDSEVAFVDREIGRLFDYLESSGAIHNTVVVLLADHGEAFGEHGTWDHVNRPYQHQVHVPLIFWAPGVPPARSAATVSLIDIAPTVLTYLGLPSIPEAEGWDLFRSDLRSRPVFHETDINFADQTFFSYTSFFAYGVTDGDWRLIYDLRGNTYELYNLSDDPAELHNLADRNTREFERMRGILAEWLDVTNSPHIHPADLRWPF